MVQAVTGSGKTLLALTAAHRLEQTFGQELYVRIVVPTSALLRQWNQALRAYLEAQDRQGTDACYLPDVTGSHLLELEYLEVAHRFSHPVYDQAAAQVLLESRTSQTDSARIKEILRCLERGSIRADWQTDVPTLERKIETAPHTRERNY